MKNETEHDYRLMEVVAAAIQQPSDQRQGFLQAACRDDAQLYQEAAETVEWEERMGNFLLEPLLAFNDLEKPFHPGDVISERFEIVREIGEGGMGVVYEAYDRKRSQRIAIKSAKTGFQRWLTSELKNALQARHTNICLVNEIHTTSTRHGEVDFLTMEMLDGQPLSAALSAGAKFSPPKFSQEEALEIARQLCAGLGEAHRSGIVHRDLKSANVILCRSAEGKPRAVITDFGLAGAAKNGSSELAGTPRYMAPELWRGEAASKASDIYALGVILYELVTGRPPFGDRQEEESDSPDASSPPPPSACVKGLNRRWDAAILPCLDPSPLARPRDSTQVLVPLEKRPAWKTILLFLAFLVIAALTHTVREPLLERLRPAAVRLAILPVAEPTNDAAWAEVLRDVSGRLNNLRHGSVKMEVTSPLDLLAKDVRTAERARRVLNATHALQVELRRDGKTIEVKASVIELAGQSHLRDFTARYSPEIAEDMPKALAGIVSAALRLPGSPDSNALPPDAEASYDRALYFLRRDRYSYDQALPLFQEAARFAPHAPAPWAGLAEAQVLKFHGTKQQRFLEDARQSLSQAETLGPDAASVHLAAGLLHQTIGQYGKALEEYQRVEDLDPRNIVALLRRAAIYDAQDMPDKAIENCQKAIRFEPEAPLPYQQLGALYYLHGKYLLAAGQFQKAVDRDPLLAEAYTSLGAAMSDLGRDSEAEQALLKSLTIRETARALNSLGAIRDQQGRDAEAAGYYRRALTMEPGNYIDWLNLGDSERRLGRWIEARAAFHKAQDLALAELRQNPHYGHIRAFVAYAKLRLGQRTAAEEEISEALHSATGNGQVIHFAALIYEALGQRDRAIEVLNGATPDGLREIDRERDMVALRKDPGFMRLMAKTQQATTQ